MFQLSSMFIAGEIKEMQRVKVFFETPASNISQTDPQNILGIFQDYFKSIPGICQAYVSNISDISQAYYHTYCRMIFRAALRHISVFLSYV